MAMTGVRHLLNLRPLGFCGRGEAKLSFQPGLLNSLMFRGLRVYAIKIPIMCQPNLPPPTGQDEWFVESSLMRDFIEFVRKTQSEENDPHEIVQKVRPKFAALMADPDWLPAVYQEPAQGVSGMGKGIGMWLLYRAGDGNLAFSALVLPSGASTPVHDHLAWGLVGLYRGLQYEEVFGRQDDGSIDSHAELTVKERNNLQPGDFYELLPDNDIHQVTTRSAITSVSLHLLGNDNGCIWRHKFHPAEQRVEPFKSGWLNVACKA